jgi:UDP-N-acetyl-D-mannosaminuronate dehydrogenase
LRVAKAEKIVVAGLGEIGRPVFELASKHHPAVGVDVNPPAEKVEGVDILHVCYPFAIKDFVGETARYIDLYKPAVTVINSTVSVGTTRQIAERTGAVLVNSPVRGKHARMVEDLLFYTKFVGGIDRAAAEHVAEHFRSLGMKTRVLSSPEATELAKLTETTYFGVIIAWAQEMERYCDQWGQDYNEIAAFHEEIKYLPPVKYFPGIIGGHCVMPNIEILSRMAPSEFLDALKWSNEKKLEREKAKSDAPAAKGEGMAADVRPAGVRVTTS